MADVFAVASKEFSDIVRSKRFIILIVIFGLVMTIAMAAIYIQVIQAMSSLPEVPMPQAFLGMMALILSGTLSSFAPVMGVALGCDTISGEREKGTLKIVLAQPVYRDTVINGKFLAAASAVSLATLITSLASVGISIIIIGVTPTAGEAIRMALFLLFSVLFTMTYYGISTFLSTILKKTSQSVILSVVVWAVFTFVISIIASLVAITISRPTFMTGQPSDEESIRRFTAIVEAISSVSPNYHFSKIGQYLLSPYSPTAPQEEASIMSSLMYAGPNILVLVIVTALVFILSYITFTRQEVR
ncbi:MAG: ABC transporter permease [Candidatus Bathyarchaeota archaeon]|nr:ABC transporter permease [Candidatus Bathyarchaeota archaeon]MDH5689062.1 ABC transporter permease [Candidatus Bathyarchaeota archaeon]